MHVLIVNDDGIQGPGIRALTLAAVKAGHNVSVYAPDTQRSAASHALTLYTPLKVTPVNNYEGGAAAYAVSGTPADCARIGIFIETQAGRPVDFVLSGINNGPNRGTATLYSGTVAAAMEASLCGIPALAVSLCSHLDRDYEIAAELGIETMNWALRNKLPRGEIYNLNVPLTDKKPEVRAADLSMEFVSDPAYTLQSDGLYHFRDSRNLYTPAASTDTALTEAGYATLSVLSWNLFSAYPAIDPRMEE